jgi:RNA polymerase subunit RPABC4/transcription elongation factor Spt4
MYECPECERPINQATEVCPYCGADVTYESAQAIAAAPPKRRIARVAALWATVFVSLALIGWLALPWHLGGSKAEAEAHGTAAVAELQQLLAAYQASEQSFPSSLEALGPAARDAEREAQSGRYNLEYTPGKAGVGGHIISYTLSARAGNYGYLNLFADETGQIHGTRENRAASTQDPVLNRTPAKAP